MLCSFLWCSPLPLHMQFPPFPPLSSFKVVEKNPLKYLTYLYSLSACSKSSSELYDGEGNIQNLSIK